MAEEHGFNFETNIRPAEERDESVTSDTTCATPTDTTETASSPQIELGNGVVAALQSKFDAEIQPAKPPAETQLILVGIALIIYDVSTLSELIKKIDADSDPPAHIEYIQPLVRRLVKRYNLTRTDNHGN